MDRVRRRLDKQGEPAELDVTSFMNLMIVLVPVLLLSMVFTHTAVIDLNFPTGEGDGEFDPELVHLEVAVGAEELVVADGRGGVIKRIAVRDGAHDFDALSDVMQELKRRMPEKRDITILLEQQINYQTLVFVMDRVRSFKAMEADEWVDAELFPVISLGDSPLDKQAKRAAS